MAIGARYKKKFVLDKNLSVSSIFSDISIGSSNTLALQGGQYNNQVTLLNFTIPAKPSFGDAELEGLSANLYVRNLEVFPISGTSLTGVAAYRLNIKDITEGGNTILNRPTVISTKGEHLNMFHDNFDGTKAVKSESKNFKLEVRGDKVVMLKDAYIPWTTFLKGFWGPLTPYNGEETAEPFKELNPFVLGPKYIVRFEKASDYGSGTGWQGLKGSQWVGGFIKLPWELGPYHSTGAGEDQFAWLDANMNYAHEIVTETSLDADSASPYSTIFDYIWQDPDMSYSNPKSGDVEDYWISSAKFSTKSTFGGGRSIKVHNHWAWNYSGTFDDEDGSTGSTSLANPRLLGSLPGTEYRQPLGAIGTGLFADLNIGIGQASVDRQEVKLGVRIASSPTALASFRKGTQEKLDDMFLDFDIFIEKLAPAYRGSKAGGATTGYYCPTNDFQFPDPSITANNNTTTRALWVDGNQTTLRRAVAWTLGDRPVSNDENLYDYVQDYMLWFCKVTDVDIARDSSAGDGNAVHKFSCNSPDALLQSGVAGQATITVTGDATNDQTITIIDGEASPTTTVYTAKSIEDTGLSNFDGTGTVTEIATSLKACIDAADGHNGKIITTFISDATHPGVLVLRQLTSGTAGNTTVTSTLSNVTVTNFVGGLAAGTTSLQAGRGVEGATASANKLSWGPISSERDSFDNLADGLYPDDGFNGHTLLFINSLTTGNRQKVRHIIDFNGTTGTITLDDDLGASVVVNDIFIVWSGNTYGATTNGGAAIPNNVQQAISRKDFAMGALVHTSKYVEVSDEELINLGIHYYDTSWKNSGGIFLWPPSCDIHVGMPKRTGANSGRHGTLMENFPEREHININMNFMCANESHRGAVRNPHYEGYGQLLGSIKFMGSGKSIRDGNIGDADKHKVVFESLQDRKAPWDNQGNGFSSGGNTKYIYNTNLKALKDGQYAGASRKYDDSTKTDDWVDGSPSAHFPQYFTLWFTNYPNNSRMDRIQDQVDHKALDTFGGAATTGHEWNEFHIGQASEQDADFLLTDTDHMESIVYLNTINVGNIHPIQSNSSWLDREQLTSSNMIRGKIHIPGGKVNNINYGTDGSSEKVGSEEFSSSFICLGFENASDITAPNIADTDSATDQKYLLWNDYASNDDAVMNTYGGWNWGSTQHSDQLSLMYSNTIERLGDWDSNCSFDGDTTKTKTRFKRGLSEGTGDHDDLDHDSFAYAVDGFKQKGWWKMKWHPRNLGLQDLPINTRTDATHFTVTTLGTNYNIADFFNGWEIYWTTGNNAGTTSKVTDYASNGAITHTVPGSGATQDGDDFDLYPTWEKRENPWASTKIMAVKNETSFSVLSSTVLEGWSADKYIIYRMGTGASPSFEKRGAGFTTAIGKKYYKSGVSIVSPPLESDDNLFVIKIDALADVAEDGTTPLLTDANVEELWICPEKYWLTLCVTNNTYASSVNRAGGEKTFSSVCVTEAPSVGTTFNELLFTDAQSYNNRWNLTVSDTSVATGLVIEKDYGFGAYKESESDTTSFYIRDKGMLGFQNIIQQSAYNTIDLSGLVSVDSVEEGDKVTVGMIPISSLDSHLITFDSRHYTAGNLPYMLAEYRDPLPKIDKFLVQPMKEQEFYPEFKWECGDSDSWYGFIIVDNTNIYNQYHNAVVHYPLNEFGVHGTAASAPIENISGITTAASGALYDVEGLAGYSLNFDGDADYIECNTGATSDPTATCTTEMSIVAHIVPDSASDQRYIVAQSSRDDREKFHLRLNTSNQVEARVHFAAGANYIELTSSSIIVVDGEVPTNIILTVDTTLESGNVKLYINGKLEDQTGLRTTAGSTNNWKTGQNINGGNSELYIGNSASNGTNGFDGKLEEVVVYKTCLYPIIPKSGRFLFTKPVSELKTGESLASSKSYLAKIFIKDYHNIRGGSVSEVATTAPVSWRKAAFALDTS